MNNKVWIFLFAAVIIIGAFATTGVIVTTNKDTAPSVTIGHAVSDENGNKHGGKAGDQSGNEVFLRSWYPGWTVVLRAKDGDKAEIIASVAEQVCANNHVGYDQYERTTLYEQAKMNNWNIEKISEACETDCSALVAVCVNAAGVKVSKDCYTGNLQSNLMNTEEFEVLTDSSYTDETQLLKRGDILLKKGHTAIVVNVDNNE